MINKASNRNISIPIHASSQKWILILVPHLVSLVVIFSVVQVSYLFSIALSLCVLLSAYYFLGLHLWLSANKSVKFVYQDSKYNWFLVTTDNEERGVNLLPESFSANYLIILNYADINKAKYTVIVTPDSVPRDLFRQLKVNLKIQ